jgi:hypothetical protein
VQFKEIFVETDGLEYFDTKIITQRNGQLFDATINPRVRRKEDIDTSTLSMSPIAPEHVYPILPTQAPSFLPVDTFTKRRSMISYADSKSLTEISSLFRHEAQMCERTKRLPHPNVAQYFGCHIDERGLITGLCFKTYDKTLYQMVTAGDAVDQSKCLSSIKAGIEHLYGIGITHCDINPHNIS